MNRKEYDEGMDKIYHLIHLNYDTNAACDYQKILSITELLIIEFPKAFNVDEKTYKAKIPEITNFLHLIIKNSSSLNEILTKMSLVMLRESKCVSCFFWIKMVWWAWKSPLNAGKLKNKP